MNAKVIVDRMLEAASPSGDEDIDAFFHRALNDLPEQNVGLRSPTAQGDDFTAPLRIVLHKSHSFRKGHEEWVTHQENMQGGGCFYGHYTLSYDEALADYKARCDKLGVDWRKSTVVED